MEQRTYDTNHWLFPSVGYDSSPWPNLGAVVRTDARNYTVADYDQFFQDVGFPEGVAVHERVAALIPDPAVGPGVPVSCIYSTGVDTPLRMYYKAGDFDKDPVVENGDGDGTVNVGSLKICERWRTNNGGFPVDVQTFKGIKHSDMIMNATVIAAVLDIVTDTRTRNHA